MRKSKTIKTSLNRFRTIMNDDDMNCIVVEYKF